MPQDGVQISIVASSGDFFVSRLALCSAGLHYAGMKLHLLSAIAFLCFTAQASWAEMGCKAVQVSCLPELGVLETRVIAYDEGKSCRHSYGELANLKAKGIYPLADKDAPVANVECKLAVGVVKLAVNGYVENKNIQGQCGAYGAVPVINMWLESKNLIDEVPMESCRTNPSYNAKQIQFNDLGDSYFILFGGDIDPQYNSYLYEHGSSKKPITKWDILGKPKNN